MNTSINKTDLTDDDLQAIIKRAKKARALYVKKMHSAAYKKLIDLLSAELPKFIPSPLAHS
ncbi:hypothetical protein [Neptunomonas sp.]|uniref:hypothetical protein n=1 Tax=Neptunomonas sp. TaxID=1971898 RepID=UPI003568F2AD